MEYLYYMKKKESMFHSLLVESWLVMDSTNSWWIDSEATNHLCNSLKRFQLQKMLNEGDMYLPLAFDVMIDL